MHNIESPGYIHRLDFSVESRFSGQQRELLNNLPRRYRLFCGWLLMLMTSTAMAVTCSDKEILPGLYWQSRGVDITQLDLIPEDEEHYQDGYKSPVLDYTCDQGKRKTIGQKSYYLPDQVWIVSEVPAGSRAGSVVNTKTSSETRNSFAISAGLDVEKDDHAFSASLTYSKTQSTILRRERRVNMITTNVATRRVELMLPSKLSLGSAAQGEVNNLPTTYQQNTASSFEAFIRQFGTHYIAEGNFGGAVMLYMETDSSYYETHDESAVSVQVSAAFASFVHESSQAQIDSEFLNVTTSHIRYYGGEWNLMKSDGLEAWQPTISQNPWLFKTKLKRISELIGDPRRKAAMDQAIDDYLLRQYVSVELSRVLKTLPKRVGGESDKRSLAEAFAASAKIVVTSLFAQIHTMKEKYPLVKSEVEHLGSEVMKSYSMALLAADRVSENWSPTYSYHTSHKFVCPFQKVFTAVTSSFDSSQNDRTFQFRCSYVFNYSPLKNCVWTDWLNTYDFNVKFLCANKYAMKGWQSEYSKWKQDRRFKVMCCEVEGVTSEKCYWTQGTSYVKPFTFKYNAGTSSIKGISSAHNNDREDREWFFHPCALSKD